mgnify:CR=1 FL=1
MKDWIEEDLRKSGLTSATIEEMGIKEIHGRENLTGILGFSTIDMGISILQATSLYEIPYLNTKNRFSRVKLSIPINGAKYLSPNQNAGKGSQHIYTLKGEHGKTKSTKHPLWITEGEKKTAKLVQELRLALPDHTAIGIGGVTMWEKCEEWYEVPLPMRDIYIAFDSDWKTNPDVQYQLVKLFLFLRKKKANVLVVNFDKGKGIDDHLVACQGEGIDLKLELERMVNEASIDGIFNSHMNAYKLADALASQYYSIDEDSKVLWSEYKLSNVYSVPWGSFKGIIRKAYAALKKQQTPASEKPVIKLEGGKLHEIVAKAEEVLMKDGTIFQRAGQLVRAVWNERKEGQETMKLENKVTIQPLETNYLIKLLTEKADFIRYNKIENGWDHVDCPHNVAETLINANPWRLPVLLGIVTSPTIREDGTVLEKPGYDEKTGLLYVPFCSFPKSPESPTLAEAKTAVEKIKFVFKDFPFVGQQDLSAIVAALLTALMRKSIRTAPMFAISAPGPGSGKSLLVDIISMIATGSAASMMSQARNEEEEKKQLFSSLLNGDQILCIDNIERPLDSDALCTVLTQEVWRGRLLGQNKMVDVPTNSTDRKSVV